MKWLPIIGCGLLVLAVDAGNVSAGDKKEGKDNSPRVTDKAAQLKKLLRERRDTLDEIARRLLLQYQNGQVDFVKLVRAELAAIKATLQLSETHEERVAALQKYVTTAEKLLRMAETRAKAGLGSPVDLLEAKNLLLEARIELLKEELKVKAPK
jgi:outer membrane protein TolC